MSSHIIYFLSFSLDFLSSATTFFPMQNLRAASFPSSLALDLHVAPPLAPAAPASASALAP
jgi:hypothetical protein